MIENEGPTLTPWNSFNSVPTANAARYMLSEPCNEQLDLQSVRK